MLFLPNLRPATALLVLALAASTLLGCATRPGASAATAPITAALTTDPARPAAAAWVRTELYFATGRIDSPDTASDRWRAFLDREVTPRFPDGLTVLEAYGQWLSRTAAEPGRLRSKILIILHEDTPARHADIEAIRLAWKQATGAQSVLRASQPVSVSF